MRIAITIPLFPPRWLAGTEIATYNIAKHLARRGYEVHVITALDKGLPKESMEEGFYVHRIFWRKIRFAGVISFWTKVFLVLRKVNPDMIHVQSIEMCIPAFIAKKLMKKPYVVWGQGSDVYLPGKFIKSISKLVLKNANTVIALTDDMKKEMQKICSRDVSVIPNGIDLSSFEDLSRKEARSKLQIKDDEKVILFVGTLRPVKGIRYLIEAMRLIKDKNESTKLFLVGDGEEREYLKNLVKGLILEECVRFIGKLPNEKVPECMVASDVFVLPSLSEGFPVVILEAMASGLPIISTKVTGLLEIVKDGKNGILVESKSPDEIAEKVLLILGDDELREKISENNREEAKRYSWDSAVDKLEEIYQKSPVNLSPI